MSTRNQIGSRSYTRTLTPRERWTVVWAIWAAYFTVAEHMALRSRHKDAPLSQHMRYLLRIKHNRTQRGIGQLMLGTFLVWFIRHIYNESPDE